MTCGYLSMLIAYNEKYPKLFCPNNKNNNIVVITHGTVSHCNGQSVLQTIHVNSTILVTAISGQYSHTTEDIRHDLLYLCSKEHASDMTIVLLYKFYK